MSNQGRYQIRDRRGFTLIEVLVVVAIIALLLAVLLPTLVTAREQSRQVVCLANLNQIMKTTRMYMSGNQGWFPTGPAEKMREWTKEEDGRDVRYRALGPNCAWGGRRAGWVHGEPENEKRSLTKYLYPKTSLDTDAPLFHCPSDNGTPLWDEAPDSVYKACGNSYYLNTHGTFRTLGVKPTVPDSFRVLYYEANAFFFFGYGKTYPTQHGKGWHGQQDRFNFAFFDGHAANVEVNPFERSGPGWDLTQFLDIWLGWRIGFAD